MTATRVIGTAQIKESLAATLRQVARMSDGNFSGVGVLIYEKGLFPSNSHSALRRDTEFPECIRLGGRSCINNLLDISNKSNTLHDGFIFFNEKGIMTHVAQYFVPAIVRGIPLNPNYGTRFRSAQY
jgi:hypothetical protein